MNPVKRHTKQFCKAISQSFFLESPWFGAGLLALFLLFSPYLFYFGMVGALVGYIYTQRYTTPRVLKDFGLITLNGFFFGIAMGSLFHESAGTYACLILGALAMPLVTKAVYEVLQHWKLSPLIAPYIGAIWVIWLSAKGFAIELNTASWPEEIASLQPLHADWELWLRIAVAGLTSIGRLLFLPDPVFGMAVLGLVTLFSLRRGFYFLVGTLLATVAGYFLSAGTSGWEHGFFSYSAGLIGLGMASFEEKFSFGTIFLFCTLSTILTMAMDHFLRAQGLPVLSLPYVMTLWLAILSRVPRVSISWAPSQAKSVVPAAMHGKAVAATPRKQLEQAERVA